MIRWALELHEGYSGERWVFWPVISQHDRWESISKSSVTHTQSNHLRQHYSKRSLVRIKIDQLRVTGAVQLYSISFVCIVFGFYLHIRFAYLWHQFKQDKMRFKFNYFKLYNTTHWLLYCVSKTSTCYFLNNSVKKHPIFTIFGARYPHEIWHQSIINLLTSPVYGGCITSWSMNFNVFDAVIQSKTWTFFETVYFRKEQFKQFKRPVV